MSLALSVSELHDETENRVVFIGSACSVGVGAPGAFVAAVA